VWIFRAGEAEGAQVTWGLCEAEQVDGSHHGVSWVGADLGGQVETDSGLCM